MVETIQANQPMDEETVGLIHEELRHLPENLRLPLILCCLEGESRESAAAQLGWTLGSLKGRLERGREILLTRLRQRGIVMSVAAITGLCTQHAGAAVSRTLASSTVNHLARIQAGQHLAMGSLSAQAATLAEGVLKSMLIAKWKLTALVLLTSVMSASGVVAVVHQALAGPAVAENEPDEVRHFVVYPVETTLQKKCLVDDDAVAYVFLDGDAAIVGRWHSNSSRVPFIKIRKAIARYANPDKSILLVANYKGMKSTTQKERKLLSVRLDELGKPAGFKRARTGESFTSDREWKQNLELVEEKMADLADEPEVPAGDALVQVYPVRTRLSTLLANGADCVVDVLAPSLKDGEDFFSAEVRASIAKYVSEAKLRDQSKIMICVRTTIQERERFGRFYSGPGSEFAKSLGFKSLILSPKY